MSDSPTVPGDHNPEDAPLSAIVAPLPTVSTVQDPKAYDPRQDLLDVRNVRAHIVNYLGGSGLPADPKQAFMIIGLLKDIDAAALGQMRITADEKSADISEQNRLAALAVLGHLTGLKNAGQPLVLQTTARTAPPELPDDVETRAFVPGESEQGTVHQTFEQFQQATGEIGLNGDDALD